MIGNLTEEKIKEVLKNNILGRIGCHDGNRTYVVPISYVYDGKFIIAHSVEGMKIKIMRENPNVCFEVDEMISYTNWKSVIAWGCFQELTDERERYYAMKLFIDRFLHIKLSQTATLVKTPEKGINEYLQATKKPIFYRIVINEFTGKFEKE